jgi:hypothetical protein
MALPLLWNQQEKTADSVIPQREQSETTQNDPIEFVQYFDQNNDITDITDSPFPCSLLRETLLQTIASWMLVQAHEANNT